MSTPPPGLVRNNAIRRLRRMRQFPVDPFADSIMPRNLLPEFLSARSDTEWIPTTECRCRCRGCIREGWWIDRD